MTSSAEYSADSELAGNMKRMQQEYNADLSLLAVITGALMCLSPTVKFQLELVLTMPETLSR